MSPVDKKNWYVPLFVITTLSIVFGLMFYSSTDYYQTRYQSWRQSSNADSEAVLSLATADRLILARDQKLEVDSISLIFRGLEDDALLLDLYILDLDPKQPYRKKIPLSEAKNEMILGAGKYQVTSVSKKYLRLKILQRSLTP